MALARGNTTVKVLSSSTTAHVKIEGPSLWSPPPSEEKQPQKETEQPAAASPDVPFPTPDQRSTLFVLPPEIRAQIFEKLLRDWNGKTPLLLQVLRPDSKLYCEALDLYYKMNQMVMRLRTWDGWSIPHMSRTAARAIRRLEVEFGYSIIKEVSNRREWNSTMTIGPNFRDHSICKATNVTSISIDGDTFRNSYNILSGRLKIGRNQDATKKHLEAWRSGIHEIIQDCTIMFKKLRSISLKVFDRSEYRVIEGNQDPVVQSAAFIRGLNASLRVRAKVVSLGTGTRGVFLYRWQAKPGETLVWKEVGA